MHQVARSGPLLFIECKRILEMRFCEHFPLTDAAHWLHTNQPTCGFTKPHLQRDVSAFDSFFFFAIKIGDEMRDDAITVIVRFVLRRSCCLPAGKFAPGNKGGRESAMTSDGGGREEGESSKRERERERGGRVARCPPAVKFPFVLASDRQT